MKPEEKLRDKIELWSKEIDNITEEFKRRFGSLSSDQLNWKPQPDKWSIAQNIDHLIVTNESYFPALSDLKNGSYKTPFIANFGFLINFFGKMILKTVQPETKRKVKTFPVWQPAESQIHGDILDKFKVHQEELKKQIENSSDLVRKGAILSSPANRFIVYRLETAFDIIVAHEKRHLVQASEVLQQMNEADNSDGKG